jgi:hypothetical protein
VLPQRTGLLSFVPCRGLDARYSNITVYLELFALAQDKMALTVSIYVSVVSHLFIAPRFR